MFRRHLFVPAGFRHLLHFGELTLLDGHGGEGAVEIAGLLVGEGRFLDVDLGAVDLGIGMGGHGCWLKRYEQLAGGENEGTACVDRLVPNEGEDGSRGTGSGDCTLRNGLSVVRCRHQLATC